MIGLALVVFVTIFANGLRASVSDLIDRTLAADIAVLDYDGSTPIPAAVVPAVANVDGAAAAPPIRDTQSQGREPLHEVHVRDRPRDDRAGLELRLADGSKKSLRRAGLERRPARGERRHRGRRQGATRSQIKGPSGDIELTVRGIEKDDALSGASPRVRPFDQLADEARSSVLVRTDQGASVPAVRRT